MTGSSLHNMYFI